MQTQFQLGSYIHACTNETHSLANLQDLIPNLAAIIHICDWICEKGSYTCNYKYLEIPF